MAIVISDKIKQKLKDKHNVCENEIDECFANIAGDFLTDRREEHRSDPQTLWFIAETFMGRKLKIVFIPIENDYHIRTAFDPNSIEIRIYKKYGETQ